MCIKKHVLQQLLDEYPKIKEYWEEKGRERRREFRRLAKISETILTREYKSEFHPENEEEDFDEIPVK